MTHTPTPAHQLGMTGGSMSERTTSLETAEEFNAAHPIGTRVLAFPGSREGRAILTTTRSEAWRLGGGDPVVMVEGYPGGIALTHIEVVPDDPCDHPSTMWVDDETGWRCYDCGFVVGHLDPAPTNDEELAAAVLARSPEATDPTPGEVGLSEAEREALAKVEFATWASQGERYGIEWADHLTPVVERILAARTADLRAERDAEVEGLRSQQPFRVAEANRLRAEAAEAEVAELRATVERVEALADEWDACDEHGNPLREGSLGEAADDLRAALTAHRHEEA